MHVFFLSGQNIELINKSKYAFNIVHCGIPMKIIPLVIFFKFAVWHIKMHISCIRGGRLDLAVLSMVNFLKFQTLIVIQKGIDKECRPRSDCLISIPCLLF